MLTWSMSAHCLDFIVTTVVEDVTVEVEEEDAVVEEVDVVVEDAKNVVVVVEDG